jgi:hypothetical protein
VGLIGGVPGARAQPRRTDGPHDEGDRQGAGHGGLHGRRSHRQRPRSPARWR